MSAAGAATAALRRAQGRAEVKAEAGEDRADALFLQLPNLQIVTAVARCGSITRAGQELCRSPSVMTRGVAMVEHLLGLELFERNVGNFIPNWFGRLLVARIQRIRDETAATYAELARKRPGDTIYSANLKHLLYDGRKLLLLIHLADARSASGAASRMGITQSGVSMALGRLEETLGVPLFHRNVNGMAATDIAVRLILHARRMRAELRRALSELASMDGTPVGVVVIGALPLSRSGILPKAISSCLDQAPRVQVRMVEAPGETLIAGLRSGEIDAVLTVPSQQFDPSGLTIEPLLTDELIIVAAADHALMGKRDLALSELLSQRWLLPGRHSKSREAFEAQLARQGLPPIDPEVQTADPALIRSLLLARQDMVALTSRISVDYELRSGAIGALAVAMPVMTRSVVMLQRDSVLHSPAGAALIEQIRLAAAAQSTTFH